MSTSNLQKLVGAKLINDMLRCESVRQKERNGWKVLVMDRLATRIISASCKMHDIMSEGITIVEDIMKKREPLGILEAVYFIQPNEKSVNELINDFERTNLLVPKYKDAHVFFTEACDPDLFTRLIQSKCAKHIKTLQELNIAFVPYERQVFILDSPDAFFLAFDPSQAERRAAHFQRIAGQIATLCATLGEYPIIRYRGESDKLPELAQVLQQKLHQYKTDNLAMGEGADKEKSILLLLDRGFDAVSPLLHELTFQAMAYDLLKIKNDVFEDEVQAESAEAAPHSGTVRKVLLDEHDELWTELRHQHIFSVAEIVKKKIKDFSVQKRVRETERGEQTTLKDLSLMIKTLPQYQKELSAYALHFNITVKCQSEQKRVSGDRICLVEQNLATGEDAEGEKIKDPMKSIPALLHDSLIGEEDKLRLIMLYILHKNGYTRDARDSLGITAENLDNLLSYGMISKEKKTSILNMQHLNLNILPDQNQAGKRKNIPQPRRERPDPKYTISRWTPYVKDLMEDAIADKLDSRQYPILSAPRNVGGAVVAQSSRKPYGSWVHKNSGVPVHSGPRLIVFILGGVCYSELRSAYEVTQANDKRWEVIIGSDHLLTPQQFLRDLEMRPRSGDEL